VLSRVLSWNLATSDNSRLDAESNAIGTGGGSCPVPFRPTCCRQSPALPGSVVTAGPS